MDYELQVNYIEQLTKRLKNDLYDRENVGVLKRDWIINSSYKSFDSETHCDFVHESGNRCNRVIKKIYVVENIKTEQILKIGSTCLKKLFDKVTDSSFNAADFYTKTKEIEEGKKELIEALDNSNKITGDIKRSNEFTAEQQEQIIEKAVKYEVLPNPVKVLLKSNIPLSTKQYNYLYKNVKRYIYELKVQRELKEQENEAERIKRDQSKSKLLKDKLKVAGKDDIVPVKPIKKEKKLGPLMSRNDTTVNIIWTEKLKKVFTDTGFEELNTNNSDEDLFYIVKNISNYFCQEINTNKEANIVTLAQIMTAIREYYELPLHIQSYMQKRISKKIYNYFETCLSLDYDLILINRTEYGFKFKHQ